MESMLETGLASMIGLGHVTGQLVSPQLTNSPCIRPPPTYPRLQQVGTMGGGVPSMFTGPYIRGKFKLCVVHVDTSGLSIRIH